MKRTKLSKHKIIRFSIRREISLWACLFAVVFQLGAPLVQAAVFNQAHASLLAETEGATARGLPVEVCSRHNGIKAGINDGVDGALTSAQLPNPAYHDYNCDMCTLCHLQHHNAKAILGNGPGVAYQRASVNRLTSYVGTASLQLSGFEAHAIRAPPFPV